MNMTVLRQDLALIADWIPNNSHVLDLGCGDGTLLAWLTEYKNVSGYGVDKATANVISALEKKVSVIQGDLEVGLCDFQHQDFDVVILSQTIQAMHHTEHILQEMHRVGREVIVTFPNFGYWKNRTQIAKGQMPISEAMPYQWYNTPNIHWCMLGDFEKLCAKNHIRIIERIVLDEKNQVVHFLPNLRGSLAFYRLTLSD
jgi:methionine biosynthesis protein MetW